MRINAQNNESGRFGPAASARVWLLLQELHSRIITQSLQLLHCPIIKQLLQSFYSPIIKQRDYALHCLQPLQCDAGRGGGITSRCMLGLGFGVWSWGFNV
jgi:hypothetical protein